VLQPLTNDQNALKQAIAGITAQGDTAMYDALASSEDLLSNTQGRRAIILLSDGIDNYSRRTANDLLNGIQSAGLSIYTIGLGNPAAGNFTEAGIDETALRALADQSRGQYSYTPDPQTLSTLYGSISRELQNEYRLTYVSSNALRDGVERNIEVRANGADSTDAVYNPGGLIPETAESLAWPIFGGILIMLLGLLFLPDVLKSGKAPGLFRRKSRVKLTSGPPKPMPAIKSPEKGKQQVRVHQKKV
jgi:von Willebrand factor type A domain-containing protein